MFDVKLDSKLVPFYYKKAGVYGLGWFRLQKYPIRGIVFVSLLTLLLDIPLDFKGTRPRIQISVLLTPVSSFH